MIGLDGNTRQTAEEVMGGDGGDAEWSSINPNALFASTYSGVVRRSSNGGESFGTFYDDNIDRDDIRTLQQHNNRANVRTALTLASHLA